MNSNPAVIPVVIEQHAEEAAFLWLLRDAAVYAPHYSLADLAHLDNRVEAHIDGLRIAAEAGWEICKEALGREEVGEVFAAAVLAYESGDDERIQTVLSVGSTSLELSRGLVSALGWLPYEQAERYIQQLITAESPDLRRIGIAASAVHRRDPGRALADALSDNDPSLRARVLRAVGQLGRLDLVAALRSNLQDDDIECRFCAGWSGALLEDLQAVPVLRSLAETDFPHRQEAMKMAVRIMDLSAAHGWQKELAQNRETSRLAVMAAGVMGDPVSVPWLIERMTIPEVARVAGESFSMITGVDIAYEDLEGEWPKGFEAGPTENPEDENVEMDPDEDLPWPNPELIEKWWFSHRGEFQSGARYLCGKPMTIESLEDVLRKGYQRHRAAAAIELAIRQPGQPLFEVRAPGVRQQQLLGLQGTRG
jgi:uncharacterized protein (TIGR02270 family)